MQRLYFLTPNAISTIAIADDLSQCGVKRDKVHIVCKDQILLDRLDLNKATVKQTSDVMHAAKRGIVTGALLGAVAGVAFILFTPVSQPFSMALTIAGLMLFGGLFGTWASTLIGVAIPDVKVKKYEDDIRHGSMLMLVDIPEEKEPDIVPLIKRHHPEAKIEKVTVEEQEQAKGVGA